MISKHNKLRAIARVAGLCGSCRVKHPDRKPASGMRSCWFCLEGRQRRAQRDASVVQFCISCAASGFHRIGCSEVRS